MKLIKKLSLIIVFGLFLMSSMAVSANWIGYTPVTICVGEFKVLKLPSGTYAENFYFKGGEQSTSNVRISKHTSTTCEVQGWSVTTEPSQLTVWDTPYSWIGGWNITVIDHPDFRTVVDRVATCSQTGKSHVECTSCGRRTKTIESPKLEHTWDTGTVTEQATLSKDGQFTYTCTVCGETKTEPINKIGKISLSRAKFVYNGTIRRPTVKVTDSNNTVIDESNYKLQYSSGGKYVGVYDVDVTFEGKYGGNTVLPFEITRATQKIKTKANTIKYSAKKVKKKSQSFSLGASAKTKLTYKSSSKNITVNKKGTVTIKKGTKAGKYKIVITAAKNKNYKGAKKTVTIRVA